MTAIGGKAADRHETVEMGMEKQVLSPSVQDGEEPDLCAEVLRIGRDFQQRFCNGAKQQVIQHGRIALTNPVQLVRQGEHHMKVRQTEQLLFPAGEPSLARLRLTLRAVSIPAGNGDVSITCFMGSICKWRVTIL
jgi:hypothetical protein